jgi:hypothetical protein
MPVGLPRRAVPLTPEHDPRPHHAVSPALLISGHQRRTQPLPRRAIEPPRVAVLRRPAEPAALARVTAIVTVALGLAPLVSVAVASAAYARPGVGVPDRLAAAPRAVSGRATTSPVSLRSSKRMLPGLDPRPVDSRTWWVTGLPDGHDAFGVRESGAARFVAGNNLFKHAPALGRQLAA